MDEATSVELRHGRDDWLERTESFEGLSPRSL
jgi:hypothetical protein